MKPVLHWPKSPSRLQSKTLGLRLRWTSKDKQYRIERFPEGSGLFIVLVNDGHWRVISHHHKLRPAKLFCQIHQRKT